MLNIKKRKKNNLWLIIVTGLMLCLSFSIKAYSINNDNSNISELLLPKVNEIASKEDNLNILKDFTVSDSTKTIFSRSENTSFKLDELSGLTETKLKKKINSQVWIDEKEKVYLEDVENNIISEDIQFDSIQLDNLRKATVPGPYPIDLKIDHSNDGHNISLTKRTWIYVLGENDVVNENLVIYADNLYVPLNVAQKATSKKLLKDISSNVNVYNFLFQPQDSEMINPLTNGNLDGDKKGLSISTKSINDFKKVKNSDVIEDVTIKYKKDDKEINTEIRATIEGGSVDFNLLRNKNNITVTDFTSTLINPARFKGFTINIPKNMTLTNWDSLTLPDQWIKFKNSETADYISYGFGTNDNNSIDVIKSFIENELKFTIDSNYDTKGSMEFLFHERIYTSFDHPDGKKHYYTIVNEIVYQNVAYNKAKQMTYKGLTGYLTTITSEKEHNFIYNNIAQLPGWLGGTRLLKNIDSIDKKIKDDIVFPTDLLEGDEFYWINGPESGVVYFDKKSRAEGGKAPNGQYDGWSVDEPNNSYGEDGNEVSMQFAVSNSKYWNDIPYKRIIPSANQSFYVEFSEYGDQKEISPDEKDVVVKKEIPQRIFIKGKDTAGNLLSTIDTIYDTNLKIGESIAYTPPTITGYNYLKTINNLNKKVSNEFIVSNSVQNYDVIYRADAKFCFKLERTKEQLTFVDLTLDSKLSNMYRSMTIELPSFVKLTTVPSSWTRLPDQTTTSSGGATRNLYRFNMKSKNTVTDIKTFLEGIKMTIASTNVNTPDTVKAYLHEEELLPDAKPKTISKDAVLKSSAVIEAGDFGLYTESKWDDDAGRSYVDLQWDKVPNLSDNGYKMYQSVDGNSFEIRSIKYNKAIKVLNIYPDLPDSNTLKGWMDGLGLTDKEGNNLIQVTPVSISDYNADPDKYLKNSQGIYQYDVLMFGSWDSYNGQDLSDKAYQSSRLFSNTGRGILFGHDTLYFANEYFMRFSDDLSVHPIIPPFDGTDSGSLWIGSEYVTVVNNGYLMKYPFEMENNQHLKIPFTHSVMPRNKYNTTSWINFTEGTSQEDMHGFEDENWINNWYLITNDNLGMIQTGHSNGASTPDERMIIANTLYNLAQVGLEENGQDYTVKDDKAPDIVATPTRDMENNVTVEGVDFGKEYYHYVTADTKDKGLLKSDTVKTEVISDLQGYVYVVDENPTTVPNVTKDAYGKVTNITAPVTNPETDRSVTIGGFTKEGQYLHIIPVDRANNVGEVKHYKLGDLAYTEEPHQTSCQHNIPQKVYIKGKDNLGNALPDGDQVLETKLRNNKKFNFTPNTITNYDYVELKEKATGSVITPEVFTIGSTKQDAEAIYRRKSAKIHIRQQVLNSNKTVVVPTQGHASLLGADALSTGTTKMTVPFNSSDKTDLDFTDYEIEIEDTKTLLSINDIVPMYYNLKGYVVTNTNKAHKEADMVKEVNSIDLLANPEIWVTVYVEPNVTDAAFYGWMYGQDGQYTVSK